MIVQTGEPQLRKPLSDIFPEFNGGPSSRGSTYWRRELQCAREGLLSNDLGWTPLQLSEALDMGLLWHLMLERFYKVRQRAQQAMAGRADTPALGAAIVNALQLNWIDPTAYFSAGAEEATRAAFSVPDALEGPPDYDNDTWRGRLERMLKSYLAFSRGDQWEILAVEHEFRTDAGNPRQGVTYTSRLDLVVRDYEVRAAPVLRSVEHKSSTFDDPQTLKMFTHDLQTGAGVGHGERARDALAR
ncbi:MAG: PD-(D/E)XK nuclease family protein [Gemmatimonadetes bacterium]|nr:PD-(D/E)XK nuclease family protein [Gemmatimonadota bacterium]